ncbi:hypothetical protein GUY44_09305 [Pimelobacter simplex]|nr:hypothetical protein [Pimelobacter simplex]
MSIAATERASLTATPWRAALRDSAQVKTAATEVGQKAAVVVGGIALVAVGKEKFSKPEA